MKEEEKKDPEERGGNRSGFRGGRSGDCRRRGGDCIGTVEAETLEEEVETVKISYFFKLILKLFFFDYYILLGLFFLRLNFFFKNPKISINKEMNPGHWAYFCPNRRSSWKELLLGKISPMT